MSFQFRPAVRENVPLLIGLAGGTGSGKTYSAMRLAKGIAGDKRFAVIDTENRRALHYAEEFAFDHASLAAPFTPMRYLEAIRAADAAGYPVIVVDSMSHEWAGDGGVLDMQEDELNHLGGGENVKMLSWAKPKRAHKEMISGLLQVRAHIILCFRAEPKIEMAKENGRTVVRAKEGAGGLKGWFPVTDQRLHFELTTYLLLLADAPGVPEPIKLNGTHRPFFPERQAITERAGEQLAAWARGGAAPAPVNRETGEVIDSGSWTNHELSALLRGHDLKRSDLGAVLGDGLTKDNLRERIDEWLADQPDMTLADLCQMAADVKRDEEPEPQAALI